VSRLLIGCFGVALVLAATARAEDPPRRVGSLNYISGEVAYALRGEAGEPGGTDGLSWLQADFNQPVCQDMSLKTGSMARARVRIGPDAIQMSSDTWLNMLNLDDQLIEASVRYGRVHLQLSKLDKGEAVELEMPRGSLWLLEAGAYDIDTGSGADDQPTHIVVFEGKARFVGGQADLAIAAGEEVQVSGNYPAVVTTERSTAGANPTAAGANLAAPIVLPAAAASAPIATEPSPPPAALPSAAPEADGVGEPTPPSSSPPQATAGTQPMPVSATPPAMAQGRSNASTTPVATAEASRTPSDDFLLWVEESDNQPQAPPQSTQYVSPETTGYDALDRYGRWDTLPDAEAVWFPTSVPDNWAPYRFGHWDSIQPWGWTWIDDQPWGFAPFHYGRWINVDGRWGWVPGAVVPDPVYAPALVAFIDAPDDSGGDPNGGPDVGWFPLGPGDDYSPWYQAGPDYVEMVNGGGREHFRDFGPHGYGERGREGWHAQYANRRFASVVSREAFANGARVDRALMRVPADRLEHAAVMQGAPRITPAAMRVMPGASEFRGEPRGTTPMSAAAGGLRNQPGGTNPGAQHLGGLGRENSQRAGARGGPAAAGQIGRGGERPGQGVGRSGGGYRPAETQRAGSQQFGRPEAGRAPEEGYRGGAQQFGRPQVSQGFRGGAEQFGRPQVPQGFRGGAEQFGRPQVAQGFRGGAQQFGRPQVFQTPGASYRGGGMVGRAAPQMMARPAAVHVGGGGGGGGRHK
jgi:hypothetical protein